MCLSFFTSVMIATIISTKKPEHSECPAERGVKNLCKVLLFLDEAQWKHKSNFLYVTIDFFVRKYRITFNCEAVVTSFRRNYKDY